MTGGFFQQRIRDRLGSTAVAKADRQIASLSQELPGQFT